MWAAGKARGYLSMGNGGTLHWAPSGPRRLGSWTIGECKEEEKSSAGDKAVRT